MALGVLFGNRWAFGCPIRCTVGRVCNTTRLNLRNRMPIRELLSRRREMAGRARALRCLYAARNTEHRRHPTALLLPVLQFYDWFTLSDASIHGASGAIEALHSEVRLPIHARRLS